MSTFDGLIAEFPDIRIDYFRNHPDKTPPAACFLSHVHSDHLLGLETLKMPFIYCSAATRQFLLKMEKYPHRINFSKGTLEARKQTYKHLKKLLRPVPLQTPLDLELRPNRNVRVTLFDANHCPGAVMFLIEGDGRAILYTGDVRAEPWWVNAIVRSPLLLPYTCDQKRLDCLYLDTTFASRRDIHREFPTKSDGLTELLSKLSTYPRNSIFYFRAWTLGYEDVWVAMSTFLRSQIHVDRYQLQLFRPAAEDTHHFDSGPALTGFRVGNSNQPGCLTANSDVKIHSCEPGMSCHAAVSKDRNVVWITPIISRSPDGTEIAELGAGGGKGDLYHCRELDVSNDAMFEALKMLVSKLTDSPNVARRLEDLLQSARNHQDQRLIFDSLGPEPDSELSLKEFFKLISDERDTVIPSANCSTSTIEQPLSNTIHFPYSRHSSYSELCDLVQRFRPKDICPCTVDLVTWTEEVSMRSLFGEFCSTSSFRYDQTVREIVRERYRHSPTSTEGADSPQEETQQTETQTASQASIDLFQSLEELPAQHTAVENGLFGVTALSHEDVVHKFREQWRMENGGRDVYRKRIATAQAPEVGARRSRSNSRQQDRSGHSDDEHDLVDLDEGVTLDRVRCRRAYEAARTCLKTGDDFRWNALDIGSLRRHQCHDDSPEL